MRSLGAWHYIHPFVASASIGGLGTFVNSVFLLQFLPFCVSLRHCDARGRQGPEWWCLEQGTHLGWKSTNVENIQAGDDVVDFGFGFAVHLEIQLGSKMVIAPKWNRQAEG